MSTFTNCADELICATLSGSNGVDVNVVTGTPDKIVVSANNIPNSALANGGQLQINSTVFTLGQTGSLDVGYAFKNITDGINTAVADSANDTLKITGSNGVTVTVTNDHSPDGDRALISLSNVPNNALEHSSITINGDPVYLGGTVDIYPPPAGVTDITGTPNQISANADYENPQGGSVILALPQDIATTSSVTFNDVTIGSTAPTNNYANIIYTENVIRTWGRIQLDFSTANTAPVIVHGINVDSVSFDKTTGRITITTTASGKPSGKSIFQTSTCFLDTVSYNYYKNHNTSYLTLKPLLIAITSSPDTYVLQLVDFEGNEVAGIPNFSIPYEGPPAQNKYIYLDILSFSK